MYLICVKNKMYLHNHIYVRKACMVCYVRMFVCMYGWTDVCIHVRACMDFNLRERYNLLV